MKPKKKKRRGLELQKTVGFHSAAAVLFCNSAINALRTCRQIPTARDNQKPAVINNMLREHKVSPWQHSWFYFIFPP